ncbi:MAG: carbon storage regulator [Planctomycetota bacterium]
MLVLSRRQDETIIFSDNIEVTVLDIQGKKVKLGITAPRDIRVLRKETLGKTDYPPSPVVSDEQPQTVAHSTELPEDASAGK